MQGVVYSIPCDGCPNVYIGQTGRSLKHRLAEHRRALKNGYRNVWLTVTFLASVNEVISCQTYLATQDFIFKRISLCVLYSAMNMFKTIIGCECYPLLVLRLPNDFLFHSEPKVARWDPLHQYVTINSVQGVDVNMGGWGWVGVDVNMGGWGCGG